jgi:hypothetical protein
MPGDDYIIERKSATLDDLENKLDNIEHYSMEIRNTLDEI